MKAFTILFVLLLTISCQNSRKTEIAVSGDNNELPVLDVPKQAIEEVLAEASPVEMAVIVKSTGANFSEKYLIDLRKVNNEMPPFMMAYLLGMLNSDLGYLNTYEKTSLYVNYLTAMNNLSDMIKLSGFFRYEEMKKAAQENKDYENLSFISMESFNRMDEHLRQNSQTETSIHLLAGVWLESMYHAITAAQESDDSILPEVIGEQKLTLNNLFLLLTEYSDELNDPELINDFRAIKNEFAGVKVTYTINAPQSVEQDGMLTVTQQESSVVEISRETLNRIIMVIKNVRNKQITV